MIGRTLNQAGYRDIRFANSAAEALKLLEERSAGVLLADWLMPEMDGLETLQNIKQQYPEIIVVMITGSPSKDNVKESIQGGASGFIVKPFNSAKVIETLKRAWNPRR